MRGDAEQAGACAFSASVAVVLAFGMVLAVVPPGASLPDPGSPHVEPVDDVLPGQHSEHRVCDEDGAACALATLDSNPFTCTGETLAAFNCTVTYWLNLTLTSPASSVCANASISATPNATPSACTGTTGPIQRVASGPHVVRYNTSNETMLVNVSGWVCLDGVCERWVHDVIRLPTWDEWTQRDHSLSDGEPLEKFVCLGGTSGYTSPGQPGAGCITSDLGAQVTCDGFFDAYHCKVDAQGRVIIDGQNLCATTRSPYIEEAATACRFTPPRGNDEPVFDPSANYHSTEYGPVTRHVYENDEIPREGMTLVIPVEVCVWAFRADAPVHCEGYNKTVQIPMNPRLDQRRPAERVADIMLHFAEYTRKTAEAAELPTVYP